MTDVQLTALLVALPSTIVALTGMVALFRGQTALKAKVKEVQVTSDQTHRLVDGTLAIQYQVNATSARLLANFTKKPEYILLADAADKKLQDHLATLAKLDLRNPDVDAITIP